MFRIVINIYCITLVYGDFSKLSTLLIFSETGIFVYFFSLNKKDSGVLFFRENGPEGIRGNSKLQISNYKALPLLGTNKIVNNNLVLLLSNINDKTSLIMDTLYG